MMSDPIIRLAKPQDLPDGAKKAFPSGLRLWTFQANHKARKFYEREEFVELRRTNGDNEEGLPDILYGWQGGTS